jgi:SAM-dependent methyltransferase
MAVIYPDYVARFYDVIYATVRAVDHAYYLQKISECKGPVLEVGVGTGRFFLEALQAGADIYGIDPNESMLHVLKQQLPSAQHFRVSMQVAEEFSLEKKFDLIIAPFRMFSHLITIEQQLKTLRRVHDHLNAGGIFIFDLFVPNLKMLAEGLHEHTDYEGEYEPGNKLRRITSAHANLMNQVNHVTMRYEWDENGTQLKHEWHFDMRYFFRWEIEHLIARSPLKLETICGDYNENPLTNASNDFVVMCRKW